MLTNKPGRRETQVRKNAIREGERAVLCAEPQRGSGIGGNTQNSH